MKTPKPQNIPDTGKCSQGTRQCAGRGELRIDPYESDVNHRKIWRYLCDTCTEWIADDI